MQDPLSVRNKACKLCPLHSGATNVCVSGEGPPARDGARLPVLILGEAPGREEDSLGRPFVGASGKLLRSTLKLEKIPYEQCYITNTVKCYPHGTPKEKEANICAKEYLYREISLLDPHYILAVGKTAFSVLNPTESYSKARGKLHGSWVGDAFVFPIWHPAYILRNRSKLPEWRNDIATFRALLEVDLKIGLEDAL
jgi:uracil-DNA glycosylase family 4